MVLIVAHHRHAGGRLVIVDKQHGARRAAMIAAAAEAPSKALLTSAVRVWDTRCPVRRYGPGSLLAEEWLAMTATILEHPQLRTGRAAIARRGRLVRAGLCVKVFAKLDISSRRALRGTLPNPSQAGGPA